MFGIVCAHDVANTHTSMTQFGHNLPGVLFVGTAALVEKRRGCQDYDEEYSAFKEYPADRQQPNDASWHQMQVGKRYEPQSLSGTLASFLRCNEGRANWARTLVA